MKNNQGADITFFVIIFVFLFLSAILPPVKAIVLLNNIHSPFLDRFFSYVTNLGSGFILLPFALILSFRRIYFSLGLLMAGISEGIIVFLCKRVIFPHAGRPISIIDVSHLHFVSDVEVHRAMSFPSGHTVTIFGLCFFVALCYNNRALTFVLGLTACLVALSRIYLLQHFLTDVAAGALIGTVVAKVIHVWLGSVSKPEWANQSLEIRITNKGSRAPF